MPAPFNAFLQKLTLIMQQLQQNIQRGCRLTKTIETFSFAKQKRNSAFKNCSSYFEIVAKVCDRTIDSYERGLTRFMSEVSLIKLYWYVREGRRAAMRSPLGSTRDWGSGLRPARTEQVRFFKQCFLGIRGFCWHYLVWVEPKFLFLFFLFSKYFSKNLLNMKNMVYLTYLSQLSCTLVWRKPLPF